MDVSITSEEITEYQGFFSHDKVKASFQINPVPPNARAGSLGLSCVNERFGNLNFDSRKNHDRTLVVDAPVLDDSIILALAPDDPNRPAPSPTLKTLLALVEVGDTARKGQKIFNAIVDAFSDDLKFTIDQTDPRNLMWFTPGQTVRVDTALTFLPDPKANKLLDSLKDAISKEIGFKIFDGFQLPSIMVQRTCLGIKVVRADRSVRNPPIIWHVSASFRVTFRFLTDDFIFWIGLTPTGIELSITRNTAAQTGMDTFWAKLDNQQSGIDSSLLKPAADFLSRDVQLLHLSVGYDAKSKVYWDVTVALKINDAINIFLMYNSLSKTFSGGLILEGFYTKAQDKFLVSYEPGNDLDLPVGSPDYAPFLDLKQFFPNKESFPNNLPTAIAAANISYITDPKTLFFYARAINPPARVEDKTVPSPFVWEELEVSLMMSSKFSCILSTVFVLQPPTPEYEPAILSLNFEYTKDAWLLHGHVEDLSCGLLYSFFDEDSRDGCLSILQKLKIESLDLLYTYDKAGASASFLFTGIITFGELQLRLFYQYTSTRAGTNQAVKSALQDPKTNGPPPIEPPAAPSGPPSNVPQTSWTFECDLGSSSGKATVGSVANSIIPDAANSLPSFVANIPVPAANGADNRGLARLKLSKSPDGKLVFGFTLTLGTLNFSFAQIADTKNKALPTKRLLRVSVDKIPLIDRIPLLNQLPQPFDELQYVWVNSTGGFTKADVDILNDAQHGFFSGAHRLMVKETVKTNPRDNREDIASKNRPTPNSGSVVLSEGHHFIVIHDAKVAIDHVFSASPKPKPSIVGLSSPSLDSGVQGNTLGVAPPTVGSINAPTPTPPSAPTKGALSFKLGPLAIDAVSLQFKESGDGSAKTLSISMDATFTMGPIVFSLLGFGIHVQLTSGITLDNLQDVIKTLSVSLEGLALAFNKPPLLIAGGFQHQVIKTATETQDIYMGGIGVSFPPYTFMGLGEYASIELLSGSGKSYKSVFLFAKLDGPLVTLEFATISGVRLGLGYNSIVRSPTIDELTQFPFINDHSISGVGNDPMALLKSMVNTKDASKPAWVSPKPDSYWFAAGMSITAFDLLTVTAVAMLSFRDSGLVASIYADAIAMMPPNVPKEAVIVYAEIGMIAEMNFVDGYFRVEAALAPTSYLLVPQCKIYGGFALCYWFPPSNHAGDFVFSIGGYHRSYTPPPWYPVPKRLGISFNVDIISITGESYFAVTPKCAMGGAMIHASLAFGPISAWLDATFDALVQFHPLHYTVDFHVSVGVVFDADFLFIHIHIQVTIGADLHIEGPEFGGRAHVDFYLFGFDVDFGASPKKPPPLDLFQFWNMLHKSGPQAGGSDTVQAHESSVNSFLQYSFVSADPDHAKGPQNLPGAAFKYILENGNFPLPSKRDDSTSDPKSTGAGEKWYVKGGSFQFRIASDFAISDANVALGSESIQKLTDKAKASSTAAPTAPFLRQVDPSKHDIFSKPMHASSKITSTLAVKVTYLKTGEVIDGWDEVRLVEKDVPTAMWDKYDSSSDPSQRPPSLLNGNDATMKQCMSLLLKAPPPELCPPATAKGFIPKFNAAAAMRMGILDFRCDPTNGTAWIMKHSEPLQTQYMPLALTDMEQAQTNKERWDAMKDSWGSLTTKKDVINDQKDGLLALFANTMAWDKQRPQTEVAPTTVTPTVTTNPSPANTDVSGAPVQTPASDVTTDPSSSNTGVSGAPIEPPAPPIAITPTTTTPAAPAARQPWQLTGVLPSKLIANFNTAYLELPRIAVVKA